MNLPDLSAQLESELAWRQDEILFFQNRGTILLKPDEQDQYRRAVVLILYAHFEGFCKFAFDLYRTAINGEQVACSDASPAIAAAGWASLFKELRNPSSKCAEFKQAVPDDGKLHRFARDREFMERSVEFNRLPVTIPDDFVDTESNLKPVVLRKILYRLGLPHDQFSQHEGEIDRLLRVRNKIANAESRSGIIATNYEELRAIVFQTMEDVKRQVVESLGQGHFRRSV
jgi:RiboL-PSP-HEPN